MYCPKCAAFNRNDGDFCSACGSLLKATVENAAIQKKSKKPLIIGIMLLIAITVVAILLTQNKSTEVYVPELSAFIIDDNTGYTCTFTYNNDGTLKQSIHVFDNYNYSPEYYGARETHEYSYDKEAKIISVAVTHSVELFDGSYEIDQTYQIDYYYNGRGQVTEAVYYNNSRNASDAPFQQVLYKYDEDGNPIKSKYYVFSDDGKELSLARTYTYTKQTDERLLESIETKQYGNGTVVNSFSRNYTYFESDNIVEAKSSDGTSSTYNCHTIENTSDIDMQSFMTIIAFF